MRFANKILFFTAVGLAAATVAEAGQLPERQRGFFISIDGLQPDLLETLDQKGYLSAARGLGWLHRQGLVVDRATPAATLTAASHVSTVTCSVPSRHGIVANGFLRDGARVSGYDYPFTAEPLWRSAMRQGKKTLVLAYVGADAKTDNRTADYSLAYPSDSLTAPNQTLDWKLADLAVASGWTHSGGGSDPAADLREAVVTIKLNAKTTETRAVNVLIDASATPPAFFFDADKDLTNGWLGELGGTLPKTATVDAFFVEADETSTLKGVKRRAYFRVLPADAGSVSLYVSRASYNNAHPASFRQQLDDANLVWPDYGVKSKKLSVAESAEALSMIEDHLTTVADRFVDLLAIDVVFYYNPLIDSLGHSHQAALPRPFDPTATDEITKAFVWAFQKVDRNLSRLLSKLNSRDAIALMGDHGMDAIQKQVNLGKLLPADHVGKVEIVSSGAMTMIYPAQTGETSPEERAQIADAVGAQLKATLEVTTNGGAAIGGKAFHRPDFAAPGTESDWTKEWQFGEALWVFTSGTGYWYTYAPLTEGIFLDPPALGMHGHDPATTPSMRTTLFLKGPGARRGHVAEGRLIDAAPTFSKMMGLTPPADCLGRPIF